MRTPKCWLNDTPTTCIVTNDITMIVLHHYLLDVNSRGAGVHHVLTQVHHGQSRRAGRASRLILTPIWCFDRDLTQSKYRPCCVTLGAQSADPGGAQSPHYHMLACGRTHACAMRTIHLIPNRPELHAVTDRPWPQLHTMSCDPRHPTQQQQQQQQHRNCRNTVATRPSIDHHHELPHLPSLSS